MKPPRPSLIKPAPALVESAPLPARPEVPTFDGFLGRVVRDCVDARPASFASSRTTDERTVLARFARAVEADGPDGRLVVALEASGFDPAFLVSVVRKLLR